MNPHTRHWPCLHTHRTPCYIATAIETGTCRIDDITNPDMQAVVVRHITDHMEMQFT